MKAAVVNYNGGAGKTTLSTYLFKPRMPEDTVFFAVETINQSATDLGVNNVEVLKGKNIGQIIERLVLEDNALIDIGASNVESFLEAASRYIGALDDIDLFVIPVTADQKCWQESLKTVEALSKMGVPAEKIRLLPNRIQDNPADEIPAVFKYCKQSKKATVSADVFVYESEIFGYLAHKKMSFETLIDDSVDYRKLAREETDSDKASEYARMFRWNKMAIPVHNALDDCFAALSR